MLLESGDIIQHSLDSTTSIHLEDGATLIQNYEPNDECDSTEVTKFIDGQIVQLEDGSTAFIHAVPRGYCYEINDLNLIFFSCWLNHLFFFQDFCFLCLNVDR